MKLKLKPAVGLAGVALGVTGFVMVGIVDSGDGWTAWRVCVLLSCMACVFLGARMTGWFVRPSRWKITQRATERMMADAYSRYGSSMRKDGKARAAWEREGRPEPGESKAARYNRRRERRKARRGGNQQ